jgi:hypothetical protein
MDRRDAIEAAEAMVYLTCQVAKWRVVPLVLVCHGVVNGEQVLHVFPSTEEMSREQVVKVLKEALRNFERGTCEEVKPGSTELPKRGA